MALSVTDVVPEQMGLLRVIAEPFLHSGDWPVFDYVERVFAEREGLDAGSVLSAMERQPSGVGWSRSYGLAGIPSALPPRAEESVSLTIAGCIAIGGAMADIGRTALWVVAMLAEQEATLVPNPKEVAKASLTRDQFEALIVEAPPTEVIRPKGEPAVDAIGRILDKEPSTMSAIVFTERLREIHLTSRLRAFRGVDDIVGYIDRIVAFLGHGMAPSPPIPSSVFSLLGVLEYADVVWQLKFGDHLLGTPRPTTFAILDGECTGERDFLKLISAFSDLLDGLGPKLPSTAQRNDTAISRIEVWLGAQLSSDTLESVRAAIDTLRQIRVVRHGQLHAGAQSREALALVALGSSYPVTDWSMTWNRIRQQAIAALESLAAIVYSS